MPNTPVLLQDLLLDTARCWPDRTALVCGGKCVSYAALARQAELLASVLVAPGVGRDDWIMTFVENGAFEIRDIAGGSETR